MIKYFIIFLLLKTVSSQEEQCRESNNLFICNQSECEVNTDRKRHIENCMYIYKEKCIGVCDVVENFSFCDECIIDESYILKNVNQTTLDNIANTTFLKFDSCFKNALTVNQIIEFEGLNCVTLCEDYAYDSCPSGCLKDLFQSVLIDKCDKDTYKNIKKDYFGIELKDNVGWFDDNKVWFIPVIVIIGGLFIIFLFRDFFKDAINILIMILKRTLI